MRRQKKGPVSIIERTREAVARSPRAAAAPAKGRSHCLKFRMQHQLHSNWCWAAVATSVALFYNPTRKWTQCGVANRELGRKDCCAKRANGQCNAIGHLQCSLTIVGHAEQPPFIKGTVPFTRAQREIDGGRPLGVRTQWFGGDIGHFIAIVGYHTEFEMLTVEDPTYGRSYVDYHTFCADYRGAGTWTHSYCTKL